MTPSTWLLYPQFPQKMADDPGRILARLQELGVSLSVLDDGVLEATGPEEWFTDENRQRLRERTTALADYLRGKPFLTSGGVFVIPIRAEAEARRA